jgi:hypothetical protein
MQIVKQQSVRFCAEDGRELTVVHTNRGEPYRTGIRFSLDTANGSYGDHLFLENSEAKELRDLLNRLYPEKQ